MIRSEVSLLANKIDNNRLLNLLHKQTLGNLLNRIFNNNQDFNNSREDSNSSREDSDSNRADSNNLNRADSNNLNRADSNNLNRVDSNNLHKDFHNKVYNNSNSKEFLLKGSNNKDKDYQGDFNNHNCHNNQQDNKPRHHHQHHHLKDQRYFSEFPSMVKTMDRLTWSYSMKLFPGQQETFTASPLVRTKQDLHTQIPFSTESFRNLCSRVEILRILTELEYNPSMAENLMT